MMGYALLWIENLAVSLLLMALIVACVGRLPWRWLRLALWLPPWIAMLLAYAYIVAGSFSLSRTGISGCGKVSYAMLAFGVLLAVGTLWLIIRGSRRAEDGSAPTAAGTWPRGKLAMAFGVALTLHLMTFWNMELAVRQQIEALRTEAGTLALSVAPLRVADSENAAFLYEEAFRAMGPNEKRSAAFRQWLADEESGETRPYGEPPSDALREVVHNWKAIIALLHQAASRPNCYFEHDYNRPTTSMLLPEVGEMPDAAKLLELDTRVMAADGDYRGVLRNVNAMFLMAQHARTQPFLVGLFMSYRMERRAIGLLQFALRSDKISSDDLAMVNVDDCPPALRLLERQQRMEEAARLMEFCRVGSGEVRISDLGSELGARLQDTRSPDDAFLLSWYVVFLFSDDLADERRLSQEECRINSMPYAQAMSLSKGYAKQLEHSGILTRLLMGYSPGFSVDSVARAEARRETARLGLAAEKYRLRHGKFPAQLDDLAPDFIPVIPLDSFDGKPMKMKRTEHGLILYSVGPNLVDDGGAPFEELGTLPLKGDITFELSDREP